MPTVRLTLDPHSIDAAIRELKAYADRLPKIADAIANGLAQMGYTVAVGIMANHIFDGNTINSLTVERQGEGKYILYAESEALLFLEFGTGVRGYGHPKAGDFGMGPGTYPGQTHALDPKGWWYPTGDERLIVKRNKDGQGFGHSFGIPPAMPFYLSGQRIKQDILKVAKEAFAA